MNTNQISNRKAAFLMAMEEDGTDINHAIAPAELMAIIAHTNPLKFDEGIEEVWDQSCVDEETYYNYLNRHNCTDEALAEIRHSFLMDPVRAKLNKIKYEKGLIPDDEILAFALFLVGNCRIIEECDFNDELFFEDYAELINITANRLKFLILCMNNGRFDLLNTVIQFAHKEMQTNASTEYCFAEVTPDDGGVLDYYKRMTDHVAFGEDYDLTAAAEKEFWERVNKVREERLKKNDVEDEEIPTRIINDEPLVERDFEG